MYSLGIEFSTQSVKAAVLDLNGTNTVYIGKFDYDTTFPEYQTLGGVLPLKQPEIRHTSPFMLIKALDHLFFTFVNQGLELNMLQVIKTDAMQHCTVYTDALFEKRVSSLNPENDLIQELGPSISRKTSPIWEDRSPEKGARFLTDALAEKGGITSLTGNRAELRFPAAQILKWAEESPDEYKKTWRIFLLSAFVTSILAGRVVPVDTGDGWGTNLNHTDINNPGWSMDALSAVDIYLRDRGIDMPLEEKIGSMTHYDNMVGKISPYFTEKYGVNPEAIVLAGTGDNPATLLGCGGQAVISLGSSYTVNGVMKDIIPSETGEYNVFGYTRGKAMALSVFTNGGKVHEHFMGRYFKERGNRVPEKEAWDAYAAAAGESVLNEDENLMLPYLQDESVPLRKMGIIRHGFKEDDSAASIRALAVSQALSLRLHSGHLRDADAICIVGGGAENRFLTQVITDVFNAKTYSIKNAAYAAPLGCAISGAKTVLGISYEEAAERFVARDDATSMSPVKGNIQKIAVLLNRYRNLENGTKGECHV